VDAERGQAEDAKKRSLAGREAVRSARWIRMSYTTGRGGYLARGHVRGAGAASTLPLAAALQVDLTAPDELTTACYSPFSARFTSEWTIGPSSHPLAA